MSIYVRHMNILLSIVIPTKDRYEVLFPTVESLLHNLPRSNEIEIVIQDNSADNLAALAFLEGIKDERLIYKYTSIPMPVSDNSELAISSARGVFVTFIGDDDLISPHILEVVRQIAGTAIDAVIYPPAYYWWKSIKFENEDYFHRPGAFWYPKTINKYCRWIDTKEQLKFALEEGAVAIYDLPRLYHGIVRKDVLDNIKRKTGKLVHGASPDISLAISISLELDRHLKIDYPLSVYGSSKNSGGGLTAEKRHHGKLEQQRHLPIRTIKNWSNKLPRIWSEMTIYPQTVIEVLGFNSEYEINFSSFYAGMLINEPYYFFELYDLIKIHLKKNPKEFPKFINKVLKKIVGKVKRVIEKKIFSGPYRVVVLDNVNECTKYLEKIKPIFDSSMIKF
jgi:glycosyltransferase involved in cell wall biosynthesis